MVIGNLEKNMKSKIEIDDVKLWVEQHGGHIFATSEVGKGTKIVIELKKM